MSPLSWSSWSLGAGATGLVGIVLGIPEPFRALVAVAGAIGFSRGLVQPLWRTIFSFASEPAGNLNACLLQEVQAVTSFNERGEGLVRVTIDGNSTDILARLTRWEREKGRRVRKGELLLIEAVDPATNSCQVSLVPVLSQETDRLLS